MFQIYLHHFLNFLGKPIKHIFDEFDIYLFVFGFPFFLNRLTTLHMSSRVLTSYYRCCSRESLATRGHFLVLRGSNESASKLTDRLSLATAATPRQQDSLTSAAAASKRRNERMAEMNERMKRMEM